MVLEAEQKEQTGVTAPAAGERAETGQTVEKPEQKPPETIPYERFQEKVKQAAEFEEKLKAEAESRSMLEMRLQAIEAANMNQNQQQPQQPDPIRQMFVDPDGRFKAFVDGQDAFQAIEALRQQQNQAMMTVAYMVQNPDFQETVNSEEFKRVLAADPMLQQTIRQSPNPALAAHRVAKYVLAGAKAAKAPEPPKEILEEIQAKADRASLPGSPSAASGAGAVPGPQWANMTNEEVRQMRMKLGLSGP